MKRNMAKIRLAVWSLVAVLTIAAIGCAAYFSAHPFSLWSIKNSEKIPYEVIKEITVEEEVDSIDLKWSTGDVNLLKSPDGTLRMVLKSTRRLSDKKPISHTVSGGLLTVEDQIQGMQFFQNMNGKVLLEVFLPEKQYDSLKLISNSGAFTGEALSSTRLEAKNNSGAMRLNGAFGDVTLENNSGSLECVNSAGGRLEAEIHSGNGRISGAYASMDLQVGSGRLWAQSSVSSRLKTRVTSGQLDVEGSFTTVESQLNSGSTKIISQQLPQSIDGSVTSGKLGFSLPEDSKGFRAEVTKTSGRFSSNFSVKKDGNTYTYEEGQGVYRLHINSGTIVLNKN